MCLLSKLDAPYRGARLICSGIFPWDSTGLMPDMNEA